MCYQFDISMRRLDDEVVRRLKQRAAVSNRSPKSEARHILECAAADDLETRGRTFLELVAVLQQTGRSQRAHTPSEVLIREDRDGGHRF